MRTLAALLVALVCALTVVFPSGGPTPVGVAAAQTSEPAPNYDEWERVARRAEEVLGRGAASTQSLEELRTELAGWRERLLAAQSLNGSHIATLRDQLAALGDPPAEGESEPAQIAERRAALQEELSELLVPVRRAEESYRRADGLIAEIDSAIREREAERLLEHGPSPLNPTNWDDMLTSVRQTGAGLVRETRSRWNSEVERAALRREFGSVALIFALGVLLLRGRYWMQRLTNFAERRSSPLRRGVVGFVVSLGVFVLPVVGITLIASAITETNMLGRRGAAIVETLPAIGLLFFGARWVAVQLFGHGTDDVRTDIVPLPEALERPARRYCAGLGLVLGLGLLADTVARTSGYSDAARVVLLFPFMLTEAVLLYRVGRILQQAGKADEADDGVHGFRLATMSTLGQAARIVAIVAPALGALGYFNAANALIDPAILTLALAGVIAILSRLIGDLYVLAMGTEEARERLLPVILTFILALGALPVLALIWGARVADLTEIWARFQEGFSLGETRIAPTDFLAALIVLAVGLLLTRLIQKALKTTVLPKTRLDLGGRNAIASGVGYIGIFLAAVLAISAAGINMSSLALVAGALGVGIGFGLQNIVSNFVSGIILLIERPISEGDWIEVGGQMGIVKSISVRSTRIETFDRTDVIVPNADFVSGTVTNWTRGNHIGRVIAAVGVAYGTDTRKVEEILMEVAEAHPIVAVDPPPAVFFRQFGADALEFEVFCILRDVNFKLRVHSDLNHEIARRFAEEGIEIPFAQRDIWLRNAETLRPPADPAPRETPPARDRPAEDPRIAHDVAAGDDGGIDPDTT